MLRNIAYLLLFAIFCLTSTPSRSETIAVNFYFDQLAYIETGGPGPFGDGARTVLANSIVGDMELALIQSSLGIHDYEVAFVSKTPFPFVGYAPIAVEFSIDSVVESERQLYGGDVAILISDIGSLGYCGAAATPPTISSSNDDDYAHIVLSFLCAIGTEETAPHEMGHILAANHEGSSGGAKPYNHPHINTTEQIQSVMASTPDVCGPTCDMRIQYSDPTQDFAATSFVSGVAGISNVVKLIHDDNSFATVAAYRTPPPPPEPICITTFFGCNEQSQPGVFVSFDEPLGYSATSFSVEQQRQGGAWSNIGGLGLPGCVPTHLSFGFFNFRVTMQTQFGSSQCLVLYLNDGSDCDDGNEW